MIAVKHVETILRGHVPIGSRVFTPLGPVHIQKDNGYVTLSPCRCSHWQGDEDELRMTLLGSDTKAITKTLGRGPWVIDDSLRWNCLRPRVIGKPAEAQRSRRVVSLRNSSRVAIFCDGVVQSLKFAVKDTKTFPTPDGATLKWALESYGYVRPHIVAPLVVNGLLEESDALIDARYAELFDRLLEYWREVFK